jgi:hypothetical protein
MLCRAIYYPSARPFVVQTLHHHPQTLSRLCVSALAPDHTSRLYFILQHPASTAFPTPAAPVELHPHAAAIRYVVPSSCPPPGYGRNQETSSTSQEAQAGPSTTQLYSCSRHVHLEAASPFWTPKSCWQRIAPAQSLIAPRERAASQPASQQINSPHLVDLIAPPSIHLVSPWPNCRAPTTTMPGRFPSSTSRNGPPA